MLSETDIQKFQDIHKKYYKKEISREDACRQANNLLRMLKVISDTLAKNGQKEKREEENAEVTPKIIYIN